MLAYKVFLCLYFSFRYRIRHLRGFLEFKKANSQSEQVFSISFHIFPVFDLVWKCLAPMSGGVSTCTSSGLSESHPVFARPLTAPYLSPVKYMDYFSTTAPPSFSTEGSLGGWQPSTVEPLPPYISLATNGTPVNIVTQQRNWNQWWPDQKYFKGPAHLFLAPAASRSSATGTTIVQRITSVFSLAPGWCLQVVWQHGRLLNSLRFNWRNSELSSLSYMLCWT